MVNCRIVCWTLFALAAQGSVIGNKGKGNSALQPAKALVKELNVDVQPSKKPVVTKQKGMITNKGKADDEYQGYSDNSAKELVGNSKPTQGSIPGLADLFVNALQNAVTTTTKTITGAAKGVTDKLIAKPEPKTTTTTTTTAVNLSTGDGIKPIGPLDYKLMLTLVNRFRANYHKPPFKYNKLLNKAAQLHSKDQSARKEMSHDGSDGSKPSQRIERIGYNWEKVAENVAWNQKSVPLVLKAWINSPGHRRNLLGDYKEFGAGFDNYYWTQEFGSQFED